MYHSFTNLNIDKYIKVDRVREVINAATASTGGAAVTGAATGQMTIAIISLIALIIFGAWGAYWKYKDSQAIRRALESGDLKTAIKIRSK